jgi:hypothetical protein
MFLIWYIIIPCIKVPELTIVSKIGKIALVKLRSQYGHRETGYACKIHDIILERGKCKEGKKGGTRGCEMLERVLFQRNQKRPPCQGGL